MNILYLKIKELANEKGVSLAQIERDLNFSNGIISSWKSGKASQDKLSAIADYFNISTDYLLGRKENQDNKGFEKKSDVDDRPKLQKIARKATKLDDKQLDQLNDVMDAVFKDIFGGESSK